MMKDEFQKSGRNDFSLNSPIGMITPSARKVYLTFPAASTFRVEDLFNYFSIYGSVQDVRIPYQQKRMFGFVTFVYPETVKLILTKQNPHFVCNDRVLVKPYKEKEKIPHKKLALKKNMLSDLPDCVMLHILSFLSTKHAVRTCILSSRWKNLWKSLPALILPGSDFPTNKIFTKFVSKVLSLRDSSISLHTLDFENVSILFEPRMLRWIVNYAISHNVQRLRLSGWNAIPQKPLALFSSQTLTHLTLSISNHDLHQISLNLPSIMYLKISHYYSYRTLFPKSLNLPALTTLELERFMFCAEPFSTFNMLNRLLISDCTVNGIGPLYISNAMLVDFTMFDQSQSYYKIDLCTPNLSTFAFRGIPYQDIYGRNISSLKHVDIDAIDAGYFSYGSRSPLILFNWLSEFDNIKSLTVTASTLQVLSLVPGLLKFKIPSLGKLKSLKVKIDEIQNELRLTLCNEKLRNIKSKKKAVRIQNAFDLGLEPSPLVPDGIVDFLLQNSPSAEVDLVDCRKKPLRKRHLY